MRQLRCADAGFECDAVVTGESDEEVLAQVGPHAEQVHGTQVTTEMAEQARGKITDV